MNPPDPSVPYLRRRNTPAQRDALHRLFQATPHPTRAQRQALASETGMELKSVSNWFQNRRQSSRRKSLPSNENSPPDARLAHSPVCRFQRRPNTPLDRSRISLDHIAALSERPSLTSHLNSTRSPLTPRKSNAQWKNATSPSDLWTHMLSSPIAPPSAPDPEEARLAALSPRAKMLYPLEWACLNARQKKWVDEDADESMCPVSRCCREIDEGGGDGDPSGLDRRSYVFCCPKTTPQLEEVEAAITLLGFRTGS